jgi:hypothetical protein
MRLATHLSRIAGFTLLGVAALHAQPLQHCFSDTQFGGWWASVGDKTIYIRTNNRHYYRLDLGNSCAASAFPGAHLVLKVHGNDTICSPLDFDLLMSQGVGDVARPCLVKTMREASPAEVTALIHHKP